MMGLENGRVAQPFDVRAVLAECAPSPRPIISSGLLAEAPPLRGKAALDGFTVYNFEVEEHHTYIAGGVRVHNQSILSFLSPQELESVDWSTLRDENNDGGFDYVEIDETINGLAAGSTYYKLETVAGEEFVTGYTTYTNEKGQLVQAKFVRGSEGGPNVRIYEVALTGSQFGEQAGKLITPYLTAAILGDDANVFESFAVDTILGTFLQNAFEFTGGYIHDQLLSGGEQNNSLEAIADFTFEDIAYDFGANAIDGAQNLLAQWIMAEVFGGIATDGLGGQLFTALANQGVNFLLDNTFHYVFEEIFDLSTEQLTSLGLGSVSFDSVFSEVNIATLAFSVAFKHLLPSIESIGGNIVSGLTQLAFQIWGEALSSWAGPIGLVAGYIVGKLFDKLFTSDPWAYSEVLFNEHTGLLQAYTASADHGGDRSLAISMSSAYSDLVNDVIASAGATSTNLAEIAASESLRFGHKKDKVTNGDGTNYRGDDAVQEAIIARVIDTLKLLQLNDGDLKVAAALKFLTDGSFEGTDEEFLSELNMRMQVASDYQAYLENKQAYDALILAAGEDSAYAAGWLLTFESAHRLGLAEDFTVTGDAGDNQFFASIGNDLIDAGDGDDLAFGYVGDDTLRGEAGDDSLFGGGGDDRLAGGAGADYIVGGDGDDRIWGNSGVDEFLAGFGSDFIHGGENEDIVTFSGVFADYSIRDEGGNHLFVTHLEGGHVTELRSVEFLKFDNTVRTYDPDYDTFLAGTDGDDLLEGTNLRDAISGLDGNDVIYGFDGDDFISGDLGDDQLFGGGGRDWLFGVLGNDVIYGGAGNDVASGGQDGDFIWGQNGNDSITGDNGDDVVHGGAGADTIEGGFGDDLIEGGNGANRLYGDAGDDDIYGGDGNETIDGGVGDDLIDAGEGANVVYGRYGDDVITTGAGDDTIYGNVGDDEVHAGAGDDVIFAKRWADPFAVNKTDTEELDTNDWGAELVYAGHGDDTINSIGENDVVFGGAGDDLIEFHGYTGAAIIGGSGTDTMIIRHIYVDMRWFEAPDRQLAAIVDHSSHLTNHYSYPDHEYARVKGVEKFRFERWGAEVKAGYTTNNGYTRDGFKLADIVTLSNAEWDALFSDDAMLKFRQSSYHPESIDASDTDNNELKTDGGNDETIHLSNQNSYFGRFADAPQGFSGQEYFVANANASQSVAGWGGHDVLYTGSGDDTVWGGEGRDTIYADSGDDVATGGVGNDDIYGGSGDDKVNGGVGHDKLFGGSGHDTVHAEDGNDLARGGGGRDVLTGGGGNDSLHGENAPDTLRGGDGADRLWGGDGGDEIHGQGGDDKAWGGLGADLIRGGAGSDTLHGDEERDKILGEDGDDWLFGGSEADMLYGGHGHDVVAGGAGNDDIEGGTGNDTLRGDAWADRLKGGAGRDAASYSSAAAAVAVSLALGMGRAGDAKDDLLIEIEDLIGSDFDDTLEGDDGANVIYGGDGADEIVGNGGADTLEGGDGADVILGGAGDDVVRAQNGDDEIHGGAGADALSGQGGDDSLSGGAGDDTLWGYDGEDTLRGDQGDDTLHGEDGHDSLSGGAGSDRLYGGQGFDVIDGGAGDDLLYGGDWDDVIRGGGGADRLWGDDGHDQLSGGEGGDSLYGGHANDVLLGEAGDDLLDGGAWSDILSGGTGNDRLIGGDGGDTFLMLLGDGHDTVADFERGKDEIGLLDGDWSVFIFDDAGGARVVIGQETSVLLEGQDAWRINADHFDANGGDVTKIVSIKGGDGANVIDAGAGRDAIEGRGGDDTIMGGAGADTIVGGDGADDLYDGSGADLVYGGAGNDKIFAGQGADRYVGDAGFDIVDYGATSPGLTIDMTGSGRGTGAAAGDRFESVERIVATNDDDVLIVHRSEGNGRNGDDLLIDSDGYESFWGGWGRDTFRFEAGDGQTDRIRDFRLSDGDVIDLSLWGAASFDDLSIFEQTSEGVAQGYLIVSYEDEAIRVDGMGAGDIDEFTGDYFLFG